MPVFNESEGITDFICELNDSLSQFSPIFIIIDDKSNDMTTNKIERLQENTEINIKLFKNSQNLGHGQSTIRAITEGINQADLVITIDGDGQFYGDDVSRGLEFFMRSKIDILEGVRVCRTDPWYRKLITHSLKYLVLIKSGKSCRDANTPLRYYRSNSLEKLVNRVPKNTLIPNLYVSIISRRSRLAIGNFEVRSRDRRGRVKSGSTWGKTRTLIPNSRLLRFILCAFKEFIKI
jgi:glycosyltransferase involved in cell wall biosynthesis